MTASQLTLEEASALSDIALRVATEAGALAAGSYRKPMAVRHKGPIDLVTELDLACEELIRDRLGRETPHIAVVAEEKGGQEGSHLTWYVDPIDGTTNYAHGHPIWCVSIGLVAYGTSVVGAVVAPSLGVSWVASSGSPARRNGEPCRVSDTDELARSFVATGFPYDRRTSAENNFAAFIEMKRQSLAVRRCGSAALDLCFVADGTYDGYWERKLRPWDMAAGLALVAAAGGKVTDFTGGPVELERGNVLATNGRIHESMAQLLAEKG